MRVLILGKQSSFKFAAFLIVILIILASFFEISNANCCSYEETRIDDYVFSTFWGGNGYDAIYEIVTDSENNIIVIGWSDSTDFYTKNAFQENRNGSQDIIITKFTPDGQNILFSSYLGGSEMDIGIAVEVDYNDNIIITGDTRSPNFPLLNPIQDELNGTIDIFLTKFNSDGELLFSTFFGGSGWDTGRCIAIDSDNNIILTGHTSSHDFNVTNNAYQPFFGGGTDDGFIVKFSEDGQTLLYSTFLGGSETDGGSQIIVDEDDRIILTGGTASDDFNTTNDAYQSENKGGIRDCFLTIFDYQDIIYSTLLGGNQDDMSYGLCQDGNSNILITGYTTSENFPTSEDTYQTKFAGVKDIFVVKLNKVDCSLNFSTLIGGEYEDVGEVILADDNGTIYISGESVSEDYPVTDAAFQSTLSDSFEAVISILDPLGKRLCFSTYNGGEFFDFGYAMAMDENDNIITAGVTFASDFYVINQIQDYMKYESDSYICKFNLASITVTEKGSIETPIFILLLIGSLTIFSIRRRKEEQ